MAKDRSPAELGQEEVRAYVDHLISVRTQGQTASRLRQHLTALKLFFGRTLGRPEVVSFISFPSDPARLPTVLGTDEIAALLEALKIRRYRVLHTTVYRTGLRISEACSLETTHIDAQRGVIHVRHAPTLSSDQPNNSCPVPHEIDPAPPAPLAHMALRAGPLPRMGGEVPIEHAISPQRPPLRACSTGISPLVLDVAISSNGSGSYGGQRRKCS